MVSAHLLLAAGYLVVGLLPLLLVRPTLRNRGNPGSTGLLVIIAGISIWSLSSAALWLSPTQEISYLVFVFRIAGPTLVSTGLLLTVGEYTGVLELSIPVRLGVATIVGTDTLLAATNPFHQLVYVPEVMLATPTISLAATGPWFLVHAGISYVLLVIGFLLAVGEVLTTRGLRRRQALVLAIAPVPAAVLNVAYIFAAPVEFDPTPAGFLASVFIIGWALFRGSFLDIVPVGRQQTVENMTDPMVVIDDENRVVDSNPAARGLVGIENGWEGIPAREFFEPFPEQFERFRDSTAVDTEISVSQNGTVRHFDLRLSPLRGPQDDTRGQLVVLRDITELKEREEELDLMRQVQSRVLRHNIRNDLQTVKLTNEMVAEESEGRDQELLQRAIDTADDLLSISAKARAVEELVEQDQTPREIDLAAVVDSVVAEYSDTFPAVAFAVDRPETCPVTVIPAVQLALENVVENAAEHNDGDDQRVEVSISRRAIDEQGSRAGESVSVTVSDNGPGIPDHELAVLERGEETPLQHGSGIGLWVVNWAVDHSTATVDYETGPDGTEITFVIPVS